MLAKRFLISGVVQGVGFRYYVLREVERIGSINGYCRNLRNGGVEVYAQADQSQMDALEASLRKGPRISHVKHMDGSEETPDHAYSDFRITH